MKKLALILFVFLSNFVFSQSPASSQIPFIEVVGTARKEIEPNQIYVSITLSEKSIDNKKYRIEDQEVKLHQILNDLNIPKSKLTLADFTSSIITEKRKEVGFKQSKQFNLILDNGPQVSQLFEKLFEANIKEADVFKLDHTDIVNYNKEVRIEALKAAKTKAEYLLNSVGNKLGKPLEIIEQNADSRDKYNYTNMYSVGLNSNSVTVTPPSEFKKLIISFSYKVKYSIE